jgi:asparagine synthase (glutamine-hydrolysing)
MCGIVGLAFKKKHFDSLQTLTQVLAHRGPDAGGMWNDEDVALGHRRLAIQDLSTLGLQPMVSHSGRYVITFNGEIYNFLELKKTLEQLNFTFQGHSDTEVLLSAVEAWGIEEALRKFDGMFALGIWDRQDKILYLARDRFGEKPLYYGVVDGTFIFASELKAIKAYPGFKGEINQESLELLLRYAYIAGPGSIYKNIFKLEAGCYLKVSADLQCHSQAYWSSLASALRAHQQLFNGSETEAIDQLELLLKASIKERTLSDVPIGAFLSGGIDSSTIVALMQSDSRERVKTFSIGFDHAKYNEAPFAKEIATHLGTEHIELYITEADALNVLTKLPQIYDEPFADSSQIPTFLVAKLARQYVTVALSGDGGDELFGGYDRYFVGYNVFKKIKALPKFMRNALIRLIFAYSPSVWNQRLSFLLRKKVNGLGDKLWKLADVLQSGAKDVDFYDRVICQNHLAHDFLLEGQGQCKLLFDFINTLTYQENMMLFDTLTYLSSNILVKIDRAAMAVSLETRVPFLDPQVFDFSWSLPIDFKIRNKQGKYLLRQLLYRYVPQKLIDRPKMGFSIPVGDWLRGNLKAWAEDLIRPEKLKQQGYLNPTKVQEVWQDHIGKKRNLGYLLWNILMFQAWLEHNGDLLNA